MQSIENLKPLVSILLPTYNGGAYITVAIQSILTQTYANWELLIIDDGSLDNTKEVVRQFHQDVRIRYIQNEKNSGIQKTLNYGLHEARGEYIARIDDDDVWVMQDKLEMQIAFLETNKEHVLVGTGVIAIDEQRKELFRYLPQMTDVSIRNKMLSKNCFAHASVVFRKATALLCGGYDEHVDMKHVEDYALWLAIGLRGKMANLPLYAIQTMIRANTMSALNKKEQLRKNLQLLRLYRKNYPGFLYSYGRVQLEVCLYWLYSTTLPLYVRNKIFKWYKENL